MAIDFHQVGIMKHDLPGGPLDIQTHLRTFGIRFLKIDLRRYCWWKKSCTSCFEESTIIHGLFKSISGGWEWDFFHQLMTKCLGSLITRQKHQQINLQTTHLGNLLQIQKPESFGHFAVGFPYFSPPFGVDLRWGFRATHPSPKRKPHREQWRCPQ